MAAQQTSLDDLRPHPEHEAIYTGSGDRRALEDSIRDQGMLEPLLALDDGTVIAGVRRLAAARKLGLATVPVQRISPTDPVAAMIASNLHRQKTPVELYNEATRIRGRVRHEASERRRAGGQLGGKARHRQAVSKVGQSQKRSAGARRADEEIAQSVGLGRSSLRKLEYVMREVTPGAAAFDEYLAEVHEKLRQGRVTIDRAYRDVRAHGERCHRLAMSAKENGEYSVPCNDLLVPFDIWRFSARDDRFDRAVTVDAVKRLRSGAPPPQVWVNILSRWTEPGDLILDPFAGGGGVLDVAVAMGRECAAFDLNPSREEIRRHDCAAGLPPLDRVPKLVVLDPPYHDQKQYSNHKEDLSNCSSLAEFVDRLESVIVGSLETIDEKGRVALIIGNAQKQGVSTDLAWEAGKLVDRHGVLERRIQVPYPETFHQGYRVNWAKKASAMLPLTRELFIARRRTTSG